MEKIVLSNDIRIIYKKTEGSLTSLAIGFEAGANCEAGYPLGTAHALEHMVYKGTENMKEEEINCVSDDIFALTNAMTNYSYCIYYGTMRHADFEESLKVFGEILTKPLLLQEDWEMERKVILQELQEWSEDMDQHCEDKALKNSFPDLRLGELIIGTEESLKTIEACHLRSFYEKYYTSDNCVISLITNIDKDIAIRLVEKYFGNFRKERKKDIDKSCFKMIADNHRVINSGRYEAHESGFRGAKLLYLFDLEGLTAEEIYLIKLYSEYMGGGTSSLLYDEIRTKGAMAYDIKTSVKGDKGIGIMTFMISTSKENIMEAMNTVDKIIENHYNNGVDFNLHNQQKRLSMKLGLEIERSIVLAHRLCTHEVMYKDYKRLLREVDGDYSFSKSDLNRLLKRILPKGSVQLIY